MLLSGKEMVCCAYPLKNSWEEWGVTIETNEDKTPVVENGLIKAATVPGGFLMLSQQAIDRMVKAYPAYRFYGSATAGSIETEHYDFFGCPWPRPIAPDGRRRFQGEDTNFCNLFKLAGGEIWIYPNNMMGHLGMKLWTGNYHEFLLRQRGGSEWVKPQPNGQPLVSIVIPCYNYGHFLTDAIDSALSQTYPNIEVIVVNDGSTDNTSEVVRSYGGKVRLIEQENQGLPGTRNRGVREARGEWVCCLDADDKFHPDYVDHCLELDADIITAGTKEFGDRQGGWMPPPAPKFNDFISGNKVNCSALFRKKVWEATGGFDEDMKVGFEDWDFWMRSAKLGYRIATCQEYLFYYRKHGPSMIDGAEEKFSELMRYILSKHGLESFCQPQPKASETIEYLDPLGKVQVLKEYAESTGYRTLIETGTYHGHTIENLKECFDEIHSIEIDSDLYDFCKTRLKNDANIHLHLGDSSKVLPEVLDNIKEPCLFWLDAHQCQGEDIGQEAATMPIWDEIKTIMTHPVKNHCVLIDDMRGFDVDHLTEYLQSFGPSKVEVKDDIMRVML